MDDRGSASRDKILRKNLLLVPFRDFFSLFIWLAALFGKRVEWRDQVLCRESGKNEAAIKYKDR